MTILYFVFNEEMHKLFMKITLNLILKKKNINIKKLRYEETD